MKFPSALVLAFSMAMAWRPAVTAAAGNAERPAYHDDCSGRTGGTTTTRPRLRAGAAAPYPGRACPVSERRPGSHGRSLH
jgi:hypothetical protein